jgi:hypothetical protein
MKIVESKNLIEILTRIKSKENSKICGSMKKNVRSEVKRCLYQN